jgi:hypothetical protein
MNPLYLSDFSRARIEEHYERSHQKQPALYNRALSERGRTETNNAFYRREKITAHFACRDPSMDAKVVSKPVGEIALLLHAREEDHAARTTGLVLRTKRSRQDGDDRSSDSSSDSSSDESGEEGSAEQNMWQGCLPGQRLHA